MYEFLVGDPPFMAEETAETYDRIRRVDLDIPSYVSPDANDLITQLLQSDSENRISLANVLKHPWVLKHCPELVTIV